MKDHEKLNNPTRHNLPVLFRALKWGRPANQQKFLTKLADSIEGGKLDMNIIEDMEKQDDADWWK